MSDKKQNSVELFAIALYEKGLLKGNGNEINDLLEQHKAIHKEEIEEAYFSGQKNGNQYGYNGVVFVNKTKYYKQTFKTKKDEKRS